MWGEISKGSERCNMEMHAVVVNRAKQDYPGDMTIASEGGEKSP